MIVPVNSKRLVRVEDALKLQVEECFAQGLTLEATVNRLCFIRTSDGELMEQTSPDLVVKHYRAAIDDYIAGANAVSDEWVRAEQLRALRRVQLMYEKEAAEAARLEAQGELVRTADGSVVLNPTTMEPMREAAFAYEAHTAMRNTERLRLAILKELQRTPRKGGGPKHLGKNANGEARGPNDDLRKELFGSVLAVKQGQKDLNSDEARELEEAIQQASQADMPRFEEE